MTIIAAVLGLLAVGCYLLCFNLVTERVEVPQNNTKFNFGDLMKSLFSMYSLTIMEVRLHNPLLL